MAIHIFDRQQPYRRPVDRQWTILAGAPLLAAPNAQRLNRRAWLEHTAMRGCLP